MFTIEDVNDRTRRLLKLCEPYYSDVSIGVDPQNYKDILVIPQAEEKSTINGWPALWDIIKRLPEQDGGIKLAGGCGTSHSYQLANNHDLTRGKYIFHSHTWRVNAIEQYKHVWVDTAGVWLLMHQKCDGLFARCKYCNRYQGGPQPGNSVCDLTFNEFVVKEVLQ